jgi:hypothetical protein
MAGLYVTIGNPDPARLDAVAKRMRFSGEAERRSLSEFSYVWLSHDSEARFAPAHDPATGVQCVVGGRLCWPTETWQRAERLPYKGGIANRAILQRYLTKGPESVAPYNGAATILIWDPRECVVHLWTDQFGYHPAFLYGDDPNRPTVFTTFPDAVMEDPALDVRPDYVSMAEFLRAWRATPPNTYYENLKHAGAATHMRWDLKTGSVLCHEYWRPFENDFFPTLTEAADALASALSVAVSERTAVADRSAFFVSGGADSRVMLYAANDPKKVWGINLYEKPTHESAIAKALCDRVGATYVGFGRDNDYYPRMQAENVRWSGAMWSAEDNHYLGVHDVVEQIGADLVMTACTTDWVFKGYGLEKTYRKFLGRNLPIKRFIDQRVDGFLPNYPLPAPAQYADEINDRMNNWFRGVPTNLQTDRDRLLVEDRRIRPTCYTVSVSGQIMYRTYPYDSFLADSRVADCYARIPAKWKLNGEVWGLAAGKVCVEASDIVDSNFGWTVNANTSAKLFAFAKGWVKRRIGDNRLGHDSNEHPPSYASWPDLGWYATHSMRLQDFWNHTPQVDRGLVGKLWGSDPWADPLETWATRPNDLMRILTLLEHWRLATSDSD